MLKDAGPNNTLVSQLKNKHKTLQNESTAFTHALVGIAFLFKRKSLSLFMKQYNLLSMVKMNSLVFPILLTFPLLTG